jgi:hypothetical protein
MKKLMIVVCLLALSMSSRAQDLPKITEEGKKAAMALLEVCAKVGALKVVIDPRTKDKRIVVADEKKLNAVVKDQRRKLTPACGITCCD